MDIFGNDTLRINIFDQSLNTTDSVNFASVQVTDPISQPEQLATKLYVDTHGGGGGGNMNFVGGTPATDYLYKGYTADGLNTTRATITDDGSLVTVSAVNGITAPKIVKTGGTGIQYLMGDGSTLTQSASSGQSNFYLYQSKNGITTPPPVEGDVGYNNADQSLATIVYISHLTRDNIDIEVFYNQVNQLSDLYIQDQNNSVNFIKYNITGSPSPVINSYVAIPVLAISSGGTGATSFGSNHNVLLAFFSNLTEVDQRLSTLESDTQNQTAVAGLTAFTGLLKVPAVLTTLITPAILGDLKIGTENTNYVRIGGGGNPALDVLIKDGEISTVSAVYGAKFKSTEFDTTTNTNISLGRSYANAFNFGRTGYDATCYSNNLIANTFVKSGGGLSTEFLKSNGTVDTNTYLTTSTPSIVSGYALNPANRATTTISSATKSYYYTVLLNQATIISGFTVYLDSGSDIFRMGIFRGNNIAGQTITLCGQSTGAVLNDITVFNRRAITAVAGQNLTFAVGEYMTVAFHSQGSTNVFLGSPVNSVLLPELTWQSNTNYAAAGFPATLNSTAILGGFTNRPCFELY